jgi:hypothetical protein
LIQSALRQSLARLGVETDGYIDLGMALTKLLALDL